MLKFFIMIGPVSSMNLVDFFFYMQFAFGRELDLQIFSLPVAFHTALWQLLDLLFYSHMQ